MRKFMRTRSPPPPPLHAHPNGVGAVRDELHSSLSRCGGGGSQASSGGCPSGGAAGGALFEDDEFPASRRSLGDARLTAVRWRRPHELSACPRFRGDELAEGEAAPSPHDVVRCVPRHAVVTTCMSCTPPGHKSNRQRVRRWSAELGPLGCARLRAAAAALAPTPRLLDRAAPPQGFRDHYCGAFRFHFWVFGTWREVRVDDRLPERGGCLLGAHAANHDYTLPLLEKAYAKLYGSYGALRGGSVARALQDLSGGVVQSFSLRAQPRALTYQVLNSGVPRSTLLVASAGKRARAPLRPGAPYCVAGLARVRGAEGAGGAPDAALVRLRAPAGGAWAGAWSPASAEWRALAPPDRDLLAASAAHPGDFWMSFNDFVQSFSELELVHVGPDDWLLEPALQTRRPWRAVLARRRWRRGYNAGGPPGAPTAAANPTFAVQLPAKCHVVVSVTQQYAPEPAKLRAIGFAVYEAGAGRAPLDVTHESRAREVVTFFTLPAGRYLVVPHTRRAHTDAAFLLRILTDEQSDVWEVNEDNVIVRDVAGELRDGEALPAAARAALARLAAREADARELDARALRAALRRVWRHCLCAPPSRELCRALVALRDRALRGAVRARDVPALVALLAYWRGAFLRGAGAASCGPPLRSAYALRGLLWAAGVTASNKVLECLVLRFARGVLLSEEGYVMALARLHLAHERYRSLDNKIKSNPLSLEEMILMTIYS
ncbi:calpain-11-like isoform X2 [Trichoplusia ni]|uniref:Calpain-11-like isoform X2 n=1 Tax=Trichoplusia ni TaxID=7111 RepID=A0A7E5WXJ4_TRINI|nr:calpain-11-like isoform X2 [Trichoplusia ni]